MLLFDTVIDKSGLEDDGVRRSMKPIQNTIDLVYNSLHCCIHKLYGAHPNE